MEQVFVPRQQSWGNIGMGLSAPLSVRSCVTLFVVSLHFQTNSSWDWYQTLWIHSFWYSPNLINFWSCSTEFLLFPWPLIVGAVSAHLQTNHWLDWSQICWTNSLLDSTGLINFWSHCTDFLLFPGLWLVKQFPCISRQTADPIGLKFGGPTHYGIP